MHQKILFSIFYFIIHSFAQELEPIKVLTIDGGGIRGLVPAYLLADIEEKTKQPISELFHLIAGSSIGGIMALALALPDDLGKPKFSAKRVLEIFFEHGDEVFYRSFRHSIETLGGLIGPKYESKSLENLLKHYFGDTKLSEALTYVLVTGYHVEGRTGIEFSSDEALAFPNDMDCLMREVARATAAAPTFFDSAQINFPWGKINHVVDGGLFANNPALHAYFRAKKLFPNRKIEVYSLGTGDIMVEELEEELGSRGIIGWASPIFRHMLIGSSESDNDILYKILNDKQENFFRINIRIGEDHRRLDDISTENLNYLIDKGYKITQMPIYKRILHRIKNTQ